MTKSVNKKCESGVFFGCFFSTSLETRRLTLSLPHRCERGGFVHFSSFFGMKIKSYRLMHMNKLPCTDTFRVKRVAIEFQVANFCLLYKFQTFFFVFFLFWKALGNWWYSPEIQALVQLLISPNLCSRGNLTWPRQGASNATLRGVGHVEKKEKTIYHLQTIQ